MLELGVKQTIWKSLPRATERIYYFQNQTLFSQVMGLQSSGQGWRLELGLGQLELGVEHTI